MTEEEAKTKWCPFARVGSGRSGLGALNRDAYPADGDPELAKRHSLCIASACMAWRNGEYDKNGMLPGYCGLAGAPQ